MENIRDIIVAKIDILEYISQYVDLKKSGKSYKGLCPFHTEKTPSFTVTPEKGLFHCFGCGASGNVITFVMKYNNLSFIDALKFLAARLGISMERDGELDKTALILKKLHNEIKDIAMSLILKDDKALNYIKDRGFDKDIIDSFSLGIIRSGFDFSYIVKRYGVDVIKESGLFLYKNGENIFKLADRLLFPIKDIYCDVIAFSGRSLGGEMPKYINSPETKIFKKGTILYNLSLAKDFIRDSRSCYIVEGYFDVIRMWSCGYKNVVSSMGTAFTKDQAALIKRYADNVVILYDGDQAGINAAYKTVDPFIEVNTVPEVVFLKEGEDPDSLLLKDQEEFEKLLGRKKDLLILLSEIQCRNAKSLAEKVKYSKMMNNKISKFPETFLKKYYQEEIKNIFNVDDIIGQETEKKKAEKRKSQKDLQYICEEDFLTALFMIKDEELIFNLIDGLQPDYFNDEECKMIFLKVIDILNKNGNIDALFNDQDLGKLVSSMVIDKDFDQPYKAALLNKKKIIYNKKKNEMEIIRRELLNNKDDKERWKELVEKLNILTLELNKNNILEA